MGRLAAIGVDAFAIKVFRVISPAMKRINRGAVFVAVVLHQVLGYLWYGVFFAKPWLAGLDKTPSDINPNDPLPYIVDVAGWILASLVMAWLVVRLDIKSALGGAILGAFLWLGLMLPALLPHYAFIGLKPVVMAIDSADLLVASLITGAILGAWRTKS
jgi:hypothetical protein